MLSHGRVAGGGSDIETSCSCAHVAVAPCNNTSNHATAVRRDFVSIAQGAHIDNLKLQVVGLCYLGMKEQPATTSLWQPLNAQI